MSKVTHDLDLLTQETIQIKIGDRIFEVPAEPKVNFTYKLLNHSKKVKEAEKRGDFEDAYDISVDMALDILNLDENNQIEKQFIIDKFSNSQLTAVIKIYQDQAEKNKNNPN